MLTDGRKLTAQFSAYTGQGVIYAVVMTTKDAYSGTVLGSAAYVPAVTYSCDVTEWKDCVNPSWSSIYLLNYYFYWNDDEQCKIEVVE